MRQCIVFETHDLHGLRRQLLMICMGCAAGWPLAQLLLRRRLGLFLGLVFLVVCKEGGLGLCQGCIFILQHKHISFSVAGRQACFE